MEVSCAEVREQLPAWAEGEATLAVRRHLSRCDACTAELQSYERMTASLAALAGATAEPPAGLAAALASIPDRGATALLRDHVVRNRRAYGGVAVAALGLSAVLWRARGRRFATA